ncbi:hypothetical protein [Streptomyces sp. NPDC004134]|uniref:hypothetical protein n=1 Tax=Streptomyces sp. NPDC004134 TaxID=3364691 RepID=UPI003679760E
MGMMADGWYEDGSFWQFAVTTAVAMAVGALGAWAGFRASNPKRKIVWWVQSDTSLISLPQLSSGDPGLSVNIGTLRLYEPRIVELAIANRGRRDVTAAMFHGGESIRFKFNAVVYGVLDIKTAPGGTVRPAVAHNEIDNSDSHPIGEEWLDFPPCLLRRGQVVSVMVLVDGIQCEVECERAPLVDVEMANEIPVGRSRLVGEALEGVFSVTPLGGLLFGLGRQFSRRP